LAENNKRAIIVGIPGVGKTTVITRAAEMLNKKRKTTVVVFGTVMFEEAKKMGLKSRDEMRRMPVEDQPDCL
jgi:adenylate kinase